MLDICKLYPQYNLLRERRLKESVSIPYDRRSGSDRRTTDRVKLDTGITRDIFEIKNKLMRLKKSTQKLTASVTASITSAENNDSVIENISKNSNDLTENE